MPYWGLARTTYGDRARAFLREASAGNSAAPSASATTSTRGKCNTRRASRATPRARTPARARAADHQVSRRRRGRALYAHESMAQNRVGTELLIRQVLAVDANHPGAHHYRIHNWDDQDGAQALESCQRYGSLVPGIGHALHMPGHIYAGLGMYHEAAISLDSATRAEIGYMGRRMVFPYNTWNYAHNRNYLSYVQEQLGLPSGAIRGPASSLPCPRSETERRDPLQPALAGRPADACAVSHERWDEILAPASIPWGTSLRDRLGRGYVEALAKIARKDPSAATAVAAFGDLKKEIEKPENEPHKLQFEVQRLELQGTLALKNGDAIKGLMLLSEAAPKELTLRAEHDDPPFFPTLILEARLRLPCREQSEAGGRRVRPRARNRQERSVRARRSRARASGPRRHESRVAGARARDVCLERRGTRLRWLDEAKAAGIRATPIDVSPGPQRNYRTMGLDKFGPAIWQPFAAPALDARQHSARVSLDEFKAATSSSSFTSARLRALRVPDQGPLRAFRQVEGARRRRGRRERDTVASNAASQSSLKAWLLADDQFKNARLFKSFDDFEEMPIHSTMLIDKTESIGRATAADRSPTTTSLPSSSE